MYHCTNQSNYSLILPFKHPFGQFYLIANSIPFCRLFVPRFPILASIRFAALLHLIIRSIGNKRRWWHSPASDPLWSSATDIRLRIADPGTSPSESVAKAPASSRGPGWSHGQRTRSHILWLVTATETERSCMPQLDPVQLSELKKPHLYGSRLTQQWNILPGPSVWPHTFLPLSFVFVSNPYVVARCFNVSMLIPCFLSKWTSSPSYCILFPKRFLWPFLLRWAKYYKDTIFFS